MRWAEDVIEFFIEYVFVPAFAIGLISLVVIIPLFIYGCVEESRRPTFELKKGDWSCTKVHEYTTTTVVPVGKVMVPQTITHHDCIQWSHR